MLIAKTAIAANADAEINPGESNMLVIEYAINMPGSAPRQDRASGNGMKQRRRRSGLVQP